MKSCVIIPCYNEEENICLLLDEIQQFEDLIPVIVNDGSTDHTSGRVLSNSKVILIELTCNLGVGGAVQTGMMYALKTKFLHAIKLDGDGQHNPADVKALLKPILDNKADIIIGSRFINTNDGFRSTFLRRMGIGLIQIWCKLLTGQWITDPTSGFRAYNRKAIEFMAEHYPSFDYPEPEEIVLARKNGLRICEVPVKMRNRKHGVSTISSSISLYYMLKVTLSMLFIALRKPEKRKNE